MHCPHESNNTKQETPWYQQRPGLLPTVGVCADPLNECPPLTVMLSDIAPLPPCRRTRCILGPTAVAATAVPHTNPHAIDTQSKASPALAFMIAINALQSGCLISSSQTKHAYVVSTVSLGERQTPLRPSPLQARTHCCLHSQCSAWPQSHTTSDCVQNTSSCHSHPNQLAVGLVLTFAAASFEHLVAGAHCFTAAWCQRHVLMP